MGGCRLVNEYRRRHTVRRQGSPRPPRSDFATRPSRHGRSSMFSGGCSTPQTGSPFGCPSSRGRRRSRWESKRAFVAAGLPLGGEIGPGETRPRQRFLLRKQILCRWPGTAGWLRANTTRASGARPAARRQARASPPRRPGGERESAIGTPPHPRRTDEARRDGRAVHRVGDPACCGHRSGAAPLGSDLAAVPARAGHRDPRGRLPAGGYRAATGEWTAASGICAPSWPSTRCTTTRLDRTRASLSTSLATNLTLPAPP